MAVYKCESCGRYLDEPWCDKCQRDVRTTVDAAEMPPDDLAAAIARNTADLTATASGTAVAPRPEPPRPLPVAPPPPPPPASSAEPQAPPRRAPTQPPRPSAPGDEPAATKITRGLAEFNALLAAGRKAIVICGGSKTGKSEIASGLLRALATYRGQAELPMLRSSSKSQYTVGGTNPDELWYQGAGKHHIFLDPSGEFFRRISPAERQRDGITEDIREEHFDFVRTAVASLAGLVLVFDLTRADEVADHSAWLQQETELHYDLAAIRWLRFDKQARPANLGLSDTIASRVANLPRLDVPVLVLFSKADRLDQYTAQPPMQFARSYLPNLHGALMTHAKRYRYDFCHTMERTGSGDRAVDRPCGVLLAMEWLLDERFRWVPRLPTRWIGGGK